MKLVNIGFGNMVSANRLVAIVSPESAPIKRIIQDARDRSTLIDATYGRRTRAVIITDSDHVILSAVQPETVASRLADQLTIRMRRSWTKVNDKGLLIVLSGPSGTGKGTIVKKLLEKNSTCLSVSMTTRSPRVGEEEGKSYFFVSRETFLQKVEEGKMLEYAEYNGNFYGTPREFVEQKSTAGQDVILEIEVQGALKVKAFALRR